MRGPQRPGTRMHVPEQDVLAIIHRSQALVEKAEAAQDGSVRSLKALHKAEQVRLLVRLAADSGARRGELVAFKFSDLDGRVLTIERGVSGEQIGPDGSPSAGPPSSSGGPVSGPGVGGASVPRSASGSSRLTSTTNGALRPVAWATGSPSCVPRRTWPGSASTACATPSPRFWLVGASCSGPNRRSATVMPPRRFGTMPTPFRSAGGRRGR